MPRLAAATRKWLRSSAKSVFLFGYVHLWAPLRNLVRSLQGRSHTVVLNYHRVSDEYRDAVTVGVDQFREQMRMLRTSCQVLDMRSFLSQRGRSRRRKAALITFDDGYEDNYNAAKILREENLACTFFISTGIVGTKKAFPHDLKRLSKRVPALTWDQIHEMSEWGFHIGNHGVNHSRLSEASYEEAVEEITKASDDIVREIGPTGSERWLSYPHGMPDDLPDGVRAALADIGVDACFSAYGGTNGPQFDVMDIRRQGVNHAFGPLAFRALLEGWRVRT